jgi:PAS domain S-box-containing protein
MPENHERSQPGLTGAATQPGAPEEEPDLYLVGKVESPDLSLAADQLGFPLVVWDRQGTIRLANRAAADLVGLSLDELIGMPVTSYASPTDSVQQGIADLDAGRLEVGYTATRSITAGRGEAIAVAVAVRAIEVDGERVAISLIVPNGELPRLGRHPWRTSIDLMVPIVVGVADEDWRIRVISSEVDELIGRRPEECVGLSLLDMAHPDDAAELRSKVGDPPTGPFALPGVRFAGSDGSWNTVYFLVAPKNVVPTEIRFALVARVEKSFPRSLGRVEELELRLRRIGSEVRAAGLLDSMDMVPALNEYPQLGELSSRQWEILNRLLRGERVPTIAKELFVSQSTVRNHLSTLFQKFGVHNQAELIERLRRSRDEDE